MSTTPKLKTKSHGGKRPGSGAPLGRRRKRRRLSLYRRKTPTSGDRKEQMRKNASNKKWDNLVEENEKNKKEVKALRREIQNIYDGVGGYLNHEQIEKLIHDIKTNTDNQSSKYVIFHMILQLLYNSRLTYNNLYDTVIQIWSLLKNEDKTITTQQLISESTMKRWGRYRANFYFKMLAGLYIVLCVPERGIMYKNDGTERNKDNLYGHVVEFKPQKEKIESFEKCVIDGMQRDITYFASYERNGNVGRLVFNYNQSIGKSADCIMECTSSAFHDINHYVNLWGSGDLQRILTETFGARRLNFNPLNHRITSFGHDRHIVKFVILSLNLQSLYIIIFYFCLSLYS